MQYTNIFFMLVGVCLQGLARKRQNGLTNSHPTSRLNMQEGKKYAWDRVNWTDVL